MTDTAVLEGCRDRVQETTTMQAVSRVGSAKTGVAIKTAPMVEWGNTVKKGQQEYTKANYQGLYQEDWEAEKGKAWFQTMRTDT